MTVLVLTSSPTWINHSSFPRFNYVFCKIEAIIFWLVLNQAPCLLRAVNFTIPPSFLFQRPSFLSLKFDGSAFPDLTYKKKEDPKGAPSPPHHVSLPKTQTRETNKEPGENLLDFVSVLMSSRTITKWVAHDSPVGRNICCVSLKTCIQSTFPTWHRDRLLLVFLWHLSVCCAMSIPTYMHMYYKHTHPYTR